MPIFCESLSVEEIVAKVGTPAYLYSKKILKENLKSLKEAFQSYPTLPCFAVKANSNLSLLKEIFSQGFGADIVSLGELERSLQAGVRRNEIVYSSIGKREEEIVRALDVGILSFNVESLGELQQINLLSKQMNRKAPVSLRINPDIDAKTHPYIATGLYTTKFGMTEKELKGAVDVLKSSQFIELIGLSTHIGSQITSVRPFSEAAKRMAKISTGFQAEGFPLKFIDMGGGLGIRYHTEKIPSFQRYAETLIKAIRPTGLKLLIEPGRCLIGNAGMLVTTVLGIKKTPKKTFVVVDAAMNDLMRPVLYEAYHAITASKTQAKKTIVADIVGPICETGDCFAGKRKIPEVRPGEVLVIHQAGAYGFSMSSNYNTRCRPVEVLVEENRVRIIRQRERLESLWALEL